MLKPLLALREPLRLMVLGIFITLLISENTYAMLQVFPTRISLNSQKRVAQISLRHGGTTTEKYRISTLFYKMKSDGSLEPVSKPEASDHSIMNNLRFSPREVELPPKQDQVVRVMFFSNQPLEEGDYRAHMLFEPIPPNSEKSSSDSDQAKNMSMQLKAVVSIAVPVVFRQGQPKNKVSISEITYQPPKEGAPKGGFSFQLAQEGSRLFYGEMKAFYKAPGESKEDLVSHATGVGSYINKRMAHFDFNIKEVSKRGGTFRLELWDTSEEAPQLVAQAEQKL